MAKSKKDPKRRRRLGLVKVDEVSLVDKPAVPQATYTIVKRDASGDGEFLIDLVKGGGNPNRDKSGKFASGGGSGAGKDSKDSSGYHATLAEEARKGVDGELENMQADKRAEVVQHAKQGNLHPELHEMNGQLVQFQPEKWAKHGLDVQDNDDHAERVHDDLTQHMIKAVVASDHAKGKGRGSVEKSDSLCKLDNPAIRQAVATAIQSFRSVADQLDSDGLGTLQSLLHYGRRCCGLDSYCSPCPSQSSGGDGIVDDLYEEVTKGMVDEGVDVAGQLALIRKQLEFLAPAAGVQKAEAVAVEQPSKLVAEHVPTAKPVDVDQFPVDVAKSTVTETLEEQVNREFQRRAAERAKTAEAEREARLLKSIESMNKQLEDTLSRADKIQREIAKARGKVLDE